MERMRRWIRERRRTIYHGQRRVTIIYGSPPGRVPSTISREAGYRWFVQFSFLPRLFLGRPLDVSSLRGRAERARRGPFVIPTLNIFLKTRFRPDFADTGGRVRERVRADVDEVSRRLRCS